MSERSLFGGSRREVVPEPFTIRGHHLWLFAALATAEKTPRAAARAQRKYFEQSRQTRLYRPKNFRPDRLQSDLDYYRDSIGETFWDARRSQRAERRVYSRFMKLPDSYPLEVVDYIPDALCGACIIGNHCTQKNARLSGKPGTTDTRGVAEFERVAKQLDLSNELTRVTRRAEFSDAPPQDVECVLTTCGIARAILARPGVDWQNPPRDHTFVR